MEKLRELCEKVPVYPYKRWPIVFVQYPEVNELLDFGLEARTALPVLLNALDNISNMCEEFMEANKDHIGDKWKQATYCSYMNVKHKLIEEITTCEAMMKGLGE